MPDLPDPAAGEASEAERLAAEFFHGDLDDDARARLQERLASDPEAARAFREAWRMEALLAAAHEAPDSAELAKRIREARNAKRTPPRAVRPRRVWAWAAASAAAACLLLAAGLWLNRTGGYRVLEGEVLANGKATQSPVPSERLEVNGDAPALLQLADGSLVRLDPKSVCTLRGTVGATREVVALERGCGHFSVTKGGGAFRVETALGHVTVLGTTFEVAVLPPPAKAVPDVDCTVPVLYVSVSEGRVRVENVEQPAELSCETRTFGDEAHTAALLAFGEPLRGLQAAVGGTVVQGFDGEAFYLKIKGFERQLHKPAVAGAQKSMLAQTVRIETAALFAKLDADERARVTALLGGLKEGQALTVAIEHRGGRTFDLLFAPVAPGDHSAGKCGCKK